VRSARAWPKSASSASARTNCTEWPAQTLAEPRHWASVVFSGADGTHEDHVLLARQELEGEHVLQLPPIHLHRRGPVEAIQRHAVFEASLQQMPFEGLLVAALDLVGQQQREKRHVIQLLGAGQGEPLWQRGQERTELQPFDQAHQVGIDCAHGWISTGVAAKG